MALMLEIIEKPVACDQLSQNLGSAVLLVFPFRCSLGCFIQLLVQAIKVALY